LLVVRDLAASLRPPGWPALPEAVRGRVRALAWFAVLAQVLFVIGWLVAAALEPGYSPVRMFVSELGRRGAAHPWIFDVSVVIWAAGFIALGIAMRPGLRGRPWGWAAPVLFVSAGLFAIALAPLRLDCAASISRVCSSQEAVGALSWRHYGHQWVSLGIETALVLTSFALARSEWPSRLALLTLTGSVLGAAVVGGLFLAHGHHGSYVGLWQRLELFVVHSYVITCAGALILEASPGWPPIAKRPLPEVVALSRVRAR
jgi:hypothetical protein